MGQFSKVEFNNSSRGWIEEITLRELMYEASLFGFIRRVTFVVGNNVNNTPVIDSGTTTAGTATTLTDSAAEWLRLHVQPGDIVTNVTDDETWEVVSVDSDTQLTVQLLVGSGTWASSELYSIEARNSEDLYIPYTTEVRCTGRSADKVFFTGVVQEAVPEGDYNLRVTAVARDSELRDGAPITDAAALAARSHVLQNAIDDRSGGATGQWLFPKISSFEGEPGLDHSPNLNQIKPDFSKSARNALPQFLDLAKSDNWCPDLLREPTLPTAASSFDTNDSEAELVFPSAQGNLAQSFEVSTHHLMSKIGLRLKLIEAVGGNLTGNIYVRIEANDLTGDVAGLNRPSGELITPWAESNLVNNQGVSTGASGAIIQFVFDKPIPLKVGTPYWIVLQYQENNSPGYSVGVDYISWRTNAAGGYTGGYTSAYTSGAWVSASGDDHAFAVYEHTDAVWYYDVGTATWTDFTTESIATDASTFSWMPAGIDDRVYIRTAGPIYGLDLLLVTTFADPEYGAFKVVYYGDNGAKITGFHTAAGSSATVLTDANMDFRRTGIAVGDVVHNTTDDSYSIVTIITKTTLTMTALTLGAANTWEVGDAYAVIGLETLDSGVSTSGSATTCVDTAATFDSIGVREGDLVVNVTDNTIGVVTAYTATTLTCAGASMGFGTDAYKVLTRWRAIDLKETEPSFMAAGTVRLEWTIPSDWTPTFLEAGKPEAVSTGFTDVDDMRGYWISIQCASIPAQRALVDKITPLPGSGFSLIVTDQTHEDVVVAAGGVDDGAGNAAFLTDTSENFITTHGVLIGDIVENLTDGSRATITSITSTTAGLYNTINGALAGGVGNDWDVSDKYRILRNRYRVRYSRNGARPYGLPANFGLTLRTSSGTFKQMKPIYEWSFSKSTRSSVNRVTVTGRDSVGAVVTSTANNLRAQREFKRVVSRNIVDYNIKTTLQAGDRAATELARLSNASERGNVMQWGLPWFTRTRERLNWTNTGIGLGSRLDGSGAGLSVYQHTTGASNAFLTDININFAKWGVEVGDLVTNITDGSSAVITSISTTTNENDSINGTLSGGTDNDWDVNDEYRIEERTYIQVGDLIQVKSQDEDGYIDADYIVVGMRYTEPDFKCVMRISKNLTSPTVGDQQTQAEIDARTRDVADAAAQRASYDDGS